MKRNLCLALSVFCAAHAAGCSDAVGSIEVEPECSEIKPCEGILVCKDGLCVHPSAVNPSDGEKLCGGKTCESDEVCQNDKCVKKGASNENLCGGQKCSSIQTCLNDKCENNSELCENKSKKCGANEECKNDHCQSKESGSGDTPYNPDLDDEADSDGDTIINKYDSCRVDTDKDGIVNCHDLDSDADTIPDSLEARLDEYGYPYDSDGDDVFDFLSTDSDGNGIPDNLECNWGYDTKDTPYKLAESCYDTDGDGIPDYADPDNDGDAIWDLIEITGLRLDKTPEGKVAGDCDGNSSLDRVGSPEAPFSCVGFPAFMNTDSDGDTIPDKIEGIADSDGDGVADVYSFDSDSDTIPDYMERCPNATTCPVGTEVASTDGVYHYRSADIDKDGVPDQEEVYCENLKKHARYSFDTDGDGVSDGSEMSVEQIMGYAPGTLVCDPNRDVQDVFDFYFELIYQGDSKTSDLEFSPSVSKLDVVFNINTTSSMSNAISNITYNMNTIIRKVQSLIPVPNDDNKEDAESYKPGFALTTYEDVPGVSGYYNNGNQILTGSLDGDLPFRVIGKITTNASTATSYVNNREFKTRNGGFDDADSGVEALYQIATGEGVEWSNGNNENTWNPVQNDYHYKETGALWWEKKEYIPYSWDQGSVSPVTHIGNDSTWGAVNFRSGSLPVIVHITNTYSHDNITTAIFGSSLASSLISSASFLKYSTKVKNPHYTNSLINVVKEKDIRILTLNVGEANKYGQMTVWSRESNAVVPACAFLSNKNTWSCGTDVNNLNKTRCCLGENVSTPFTFNGKDDQCALVFTGTQTSLSSYISNGLEALIKYGTYDVTTVVRGVKIPGKEYGTECFIKKVEAKKYIAPPEEPEASCNPKAIASTLDDSHDYKDGFLDFAPGVAISDSDVANNITSKQGAKLQFLVVAQNDNCVEATETPQVFDAYIDVVNNKTKMVLSSRKVSIIVPAQKVQHVQEIY